MSDEQVKQLFDQLVLTSADSETRLDSDPIIIKHNVCPGDTVERVALLYGAQTTELKRVNRLLWGASDLSLRRTVLVPVESKEHLLATIQNNYDSLMEHVSVSSTSSTGGVAVSSNSRGQAAGDGEWTPPPANCGDLKAQFCAECSNSDDQLAEEYLAAFNWDVSLAVAKHRRDQQLASRFPGNGKVHSNGSNTNFFPHNDDGAGSATDAATSPTHSKSTFRKTDASALHSPTRLSAAKNPSISGKPGYLQQPASQPANSARRSAVLRLKEAEESIFQL